MLIYHVDSKVNVYFQVRPLSKLIGGQCIWLCKSYIYSCTATLWWHQIPNIQPTQTNSPVTLLSHKHQLICHVVAVVMQIDVCSGQGSWLLWHMTGSDSDSVMFLMIATFWVSHIPWWHNDREILSALLALYEGNWPGMLPLWFVSLTSLPIAVWWGHGSTTILALCVGNH